MLFTWNMEEDNTWTPAALSTSLAAIAYDGVMDRLYLRIPRRTPGSCTRWI